MLRLTLLWMFVTYFVIYAQKDWYRTLCILIVFMGIIEHPDMPKSVFGIQGVNPWNVMLLSVLIGWKRDKARLNTAGGFPKTIKFLIIWYLSIIFISHVRLILNMDGLQEWMSVAGKEPESVKSLFSEQIVNSLKWLIPAYLLYDGCNSQKRFDLAIAAIAGVYILLGLQVIKWMPFSAITGGEGLSERSLKILVNEIGYHRVNLSMLLAGGFWVVISALKIIKSKKYLFAAYASAFSVFLGQMLTGGRTGYVTWAVVGLFLGIFKWRKIILLAPLLALLVLYSVPGVYERLMHGVEGESAETEVNTRAYEYSDEVGNLEDSTDLNLYAMTSGRSIAWPFVIDKISERLFLGYGRMAMVNTGITEFLWNNLKESFPHPHNAYLELIFDNGLIGAVPVFILFLLFMIYSVSLFRDPNINNNVVAGGVAISLTFAFLVASLGSQTFYPREGSVGMWCSIALMLRFYVNRRIAETENIKINDGFLDENRGVKVKA